MADRLNAPTAKEQVRLELRRLAAEQAALRRVAVLVAQAAPPEEVFAAVTAEAGWLLDADVAHGGAPIRGASELSHDLAAELLRSGARDLITATR
jgi:hypothetical protein